MTEHFITLSTTEPNNNVGIVKLRHADVNSQAIVVQIVENGQSKSFEGLQPYFCLMAQETTGQGVSEESIVSFDAKKGTLTYTASDNALQFVGRNEAYFSFRKQVGDQWVEQFSTRTFHYIVEKSIYSQPFKDSNYWWTFKELNRIFNQYIDDGKISWEEFVNQNKEIIQSVDPGGVLLTRLGIFSSFRDWDFSILEKVKNEFEERGVNVKWFGAKGDGVTDDTVAIQSAIDYAYARRPMTVILPMAKYAIQPVVVKDGVRLVSSTANIPYAWNEPVESGFIAKSATDNFLVTVEKGATLENIIVDSNSISSGVQCKRDGKLENVTCFRSKSTGIILRGGIANNIRSGHNLGQGVVIAESDTLLSNFLIFGNQGDGLELQKWVNNNSVVNGKIEFNDKANISLFYNGNNYFTNVNIDRSGSYGIRAAGATASFVNCQLLRSFKTESGGAHIYMEGNTTVNLIGGNISKGVDDDGGGLESPAYIAKAYDSTKMTLNIVGVSAANACTVAPIYGAIKLGLSSTLLADSIESKSDAHTFTPIAPSVLLQKKEGQVFYNNNTKRLEMYNGSSLVGTNGLNAGQNYYDRKSVSVSKSSSQSVTLSLGFEVSQYARLGATLEFHMRRAESGSGGVTKIPIMLARESTTTTVAVGTPQNLIGSLFNATDLVISNVSIDINNVLTVVILNNNASLSANGQIILSQ
ncbi:BppU family phage baseplate upper protein [Lactococcus lactis]|uniref:BppU family phage baseplate upper protein n=1 Tax=Lactococcus lactis TaxID=1358 RepID=UPI0014782029|nr:BppU family phage baseplate upper protein [Lactococcus lactis]